MADTAFRLPAQKVAAALLAQMVPDDKTEFQLALLNELWKSHEEGMLAESVVRVIRDWVAHARFESSHVVQERLKIVKQADA